MVLDAGQGNIFIKAEFPYLIHLFDCFFSLSNFQETKF